MNSKKMLIFVALFVVYIFWGGTYLAMRFAIETLPPYFMAGARFITAGLLLLLWQLARGSQRPQAVHWKNAAIVGGLLLLGGNGGVAWAERIIPSGIAAIIIGTVPLWMVILSWLFKGHELPGKPVMIGLIMGFLGIVLLVRTSLVSADSTSEQWIGYIVLVLAALSWAAGSVYSREATLPTSPMTAVSLQMVTGGFLCLLMGLVLGEANNLNIAHISARSLFSFIYLVVFGSIVAYTAYFWLLKNADTTVVSTYAYVNPVVAVLLGWSFAGEKLTSNDLLATAIIVASVVIVTKFNSGVKATKTANLGRAR